MRELRFRVWDKRHKQFSYWGYTKGGFKCIPTNNTGMTMDYVKENTEQFTGLYDRNGKEIYEGDVVSGVWYAQTSINPDSWFTTEFIGHVKYEDGCFYMCPHDKSVMPFHYPDYEIELIGNIHENPELLGGEK